MSNSYSKSSGVNADEILENLEYKLQLLKKYSKKQGNQPEDEELSTLSPVSPGILQMDLRKIEEIARILIDLVENSDCKELAGRNKGLVIF